MVADNKRKSAGPGQAPTPKKFQKPPPQKNTPKGISANLARDAKPPMKIEVVQPTEKKAAGGPGAPGLKKFDPKSKGIKKDNKNKGKKPGTPQQSGKKQQSNQQSKGKKKNRYQRLQAKLDKNVRTKASCQSALLAEQQLSQSGRVFTVKLPDPEVSPTLVNGWSSAIETAIFTKPVDPRQFLIVLKPGVDVKKEIDALRKVNFNGSKITVEEKSEGDHHLTSGADLIDPYTLYVTNLDESVSREALKPLFAKASNIMNPRKHNPRIKSSGKFTFIAFDSTDEALASFKANYSNVISGKSLVMRFRRIAQNERKAIVDESAPAVVAAVTPAKQVKKEVASPDKKGKVEAATPGKQLAKVTPLKPVKVETPASAQKKAVLAVKQVEEDEDDDDDDEDDEGMELDDEDDDDDDDDTEQVEGADDDDDDDDDDEEDDDDDDDDDDDEEDSD